MIAGTTYTYTDEKNPFLQVMNPSPDYTPGVEDAKIINKVMNRFMQMKSARARIDTDWQIWQTISESKFFPYADGRTRVNVPLFRSLQEIFVSEATTRRIDKEIQPVGLSDMDKAEVMSEVWDFDWNKNKRDEQMTDAEYKCCAMGTVAYLTAFEQNTRIINDPDVSDE